MEEFENNGSIVIRCTRAGFVDFSDDFLSVPENQNWQRQDVLKYVFFSSKYFCFYIGMQKCYTAALSRSAYRTAVPSANTELSGNNSVDLRASHVFACARTRMRFWNHDTNRRVFARATRTENRTLFYFYLNFFFVFFDASRGIGHTRGSSSTRKRKVSHDFVVSQPSSLQLVTTWFPE